MKTLRTDRWQLLWLASLCVPAAANTAPDSLSSGAVVVWAACGLITLARGFYLGRSAGADLAALGRATAWGGAVVVASWLTRGVFDGASIGLTARRGVVGLLLTMGVVATLLGIGASLAALHPPFTRPSPTKAVAGLAGFLLAVAGFALVGPVAVFTVGHLTQSTAALAIAAIIGVGLLVGLPGWTLLGRRRSTAHALGRGLTAGACMTIAGLVGLGANAHFGPYGLTSHDIATQAAGSIGPGPPAYYLGDKVAGMRVVTVGHEGQMLFFEYGRCMEGGDPGVLGTDISCTPPVEVTNEPAITWKPPGRCVESGRVGGVPTVIAGGAITLFTGRKAVTILALTANSEGYVGDPDRARDLAQWIHAVGSVSTMPPPDSQAAQHVGTICDGP